MKKIFNTQRNIGKAKYIINHHDGVKKHHDGSPFFDITLFKNKAKFNVFIDELTQQGYQSQTTAISQEKPAFDISAINNKIEALAIYLGINSAVDSELASIETRHVSNIDTYSHKGKTYYVAASSYGLQSDKVIQFNSRLWSVLEEKEDSPYHRFTDRKVTETLQAVAPAGHSLLAISQSEQKILFKTNYNRFVIFEYTSHHPNDLSTYRLTGKTTLSLLQARQLGWYLYH